MPRPKKLICDCGRKRRLHRETGWTSCRYCQMLYDDRGYPGRAARRAARVLPLGVASMLARELGVRPWSVHQVARGQLTSARISAALAAWKERTQGDVR